jgi:Mn2+/Fe2+ NRAMP family transporter
MKKVLEVFLGILTAMGGFVEIGELTFTLNAGSLFSYHLLWVAALGTVGIIVYCEMAGRVAAVRGQPIFAVIRERVGFNAGLVTLIAANAVCLMTCAAEIGAIALLWQLLSGWPYRPLIVLALPFFLLVVWFFKFAWIERVFGFMGVAMAVFIVAAISMQPDWSAFAAGFVPSLPPITSERQLLLYAFFAVSLLSSIMLPYETYFYASGGIEDQWKPSDVTLNRVIVLVGFLLGGALAMALITVGAEYLAPRHIQAELPGTAALAVSSHLGRIGFVVALIGMFFAFAGAAIEATMSAAYNLAQFLGWPWGKFRPPQQASRFTLAWIVTFALATALILTGIDPIQVVEYAIVFSVVILPLTYFPLLLVAHDPVVMGKYANGPVATVVGWTFFVIILIAATAALPLMIATHGGQG